MHPSQDSGGSEGLVCLQMTELVEEGRTESSANLQEVVSVAVVHGAVVDAWVFVAAVQKEPDIG